jgi:hypothetical protein
MLNILEGTRVDIQSALDQLSKSYLIEHRPTANVKISMGPKVSLQSKRNRIATLLENEA